MNQTRASLMRAKVETLRRSKGAFRAHPGQLRASRWPRRSTDPAAAPAQKRTHERLTSIDIGVAAVIDADGAYHGFLREQNGRVVTLPEAPGAQPGMGGTQPSAINDRGQIAGVAYDARGGSRGFLLERGVLTMLDGRGAVYTRGLDINNRGEIVGDYGTRASADSAVAQKYIPPNCPPVTVSAWPCT
jgi:uncharacterized membrane protein